MSRASILFEQADALRWVLRHPLNRGHVGRALSRWLLWHLRTRIGSRTATAIPFVANTRLFGGRALTTVNVQHYVGLGELDVMGFLLHLLRPNDLMIDVGANVGAISVMAGGIGARVVALEPVPDTFDWLRKNVELNKLGGKIDCLNMAVGERPDTIRMSSGQGAGNRVERADADGAVDCPCATLERIVAGRAVTVVKIDVEGFEVPVVRGGAALWAQPSLKAVVAELKGHGNHYGFDEDEVIATLASYGFEPCTYDALSRELLPLSEAPERPDNLIFVRDRAALQEQLAAAPRRPVIWDRRI